MIEIKLDEKKLAQVQALLRSIPKGMPKVMSRAINKTAGKARTDLTKALADKVALKKKYIRDNIKLRKASYRRWQADLSLAYWPINLRHFGARQTKTGVSYQIFKDGGRALLEHAFIVERFGKNVFKRLAPDDDPEGIVTRHGGSAPSVPRLPISIQRGPSLKEIYTEDSALPARTMADAMQNLERNVDMQIRVLLERRR
ncbi:MAG TPA: phage tail protein [Anaerohalosphaeraceae bacterium]|nr:phage tail protein [Anaerohalosphaeraceae bacterium]